jgi:transposase
MTYSGDLNADRLIEFIFQLVKNKGKKTFLILDKLRIHHSKIIKQWLERRKANDVFYRPSYSPRKNPYEYVNCDLIYGLSKNHLLKIISN